MAFLAMNEKDHPVTEGMIGELERGDLKDQIEQMIRKSQQMIDDMKKTRTEKEIKKNASTRECLSQPDVSPPVDLPSEQKFIKNPQQMRKNAKTVRTEQEKIRKKKKRESPSPSVGPLRDEQSEGVAAVDPKVEMWALQTFEMIFASVTELGPYTERLALQLSTIKQLSSSVCGTSDHASAADLILKCISSCTDVKHSVDNSLSDLEHLAGQMQDEATLDEQIPSLDERKPSVDDRVPTLVELDEWMTFLRMVKGYRAGMRMESAQQKLREMRSEGDGRINHTIQVAEDEFEFIDEEPEPMLETQQLIESVIIHESLIETVTGAEEVPEMFERVEMSIPEIIPSQDSEPDAQMNAKYKGFNCAVAAKQRLKTIKNPLTVFAKTSTKPASKFEMMSKDATLTKTFKPMLHAHWRRHMITPTSPTVA